MLMLALLLLLAQDFDEAHRALLPDKKEKWQTIPWRTGLLEARDLAIREGKPLFLWSMNGHPLGCT